MSDIDYNRYKFSCNCPDAAKKRSFNLKEGSPPLTFDWSKTNAGAQSGVCKHVWAVKILLGLVGKDDVPSDVPLPNALTEDTSNDFEQWQDGYGGHAFTPTKQGFSPPGFNFYKGG